MFVATLLAAPARADLSRATVESLRDAWSGGAAQWLSPGTAAEFALPNVPVNRWEVWAGLQGIGVDLVVQPAEGRRKRLLLADMDSTMIGQECIDELADMAGVGPRVAAITERAMNGELDFEGALLERVGLLRGLGESVIADVLRDRITLTPGARTGTEGKLGALRQRGPHRAMPTLRAVRHRGMKAHRSTSPMTTSSDPITAITSAIMPPTTNLCSA